MFDRLIESEPAGADFRNRRSYFMVSSLVVGVVFAAAVVISIYAAEIDLGTSSLELVEMIAPPETAPMEPEPELPRAAALAAAPQRVLPTRQAAIARIDESPIASTETSVVPNRQLSRPVGDYRIDRFDSNPTGGVSSGRDPSSSGSSGLSMSDTQSTGSRPADPEPVAPPPPAAKPRSTRPVSKGPLNGHAVSLPKPAYPEIARRVGAQGPVVVQVTIDESGRVISANAISGHPMLKAEAERAARAARFSPTLLADVPVKVTGVITYNFTKH